MTNNQPIGIFAQARALLYSENIRIIALTSMLTGTYVSLLNTILQPYVVNYLGFDVVILGILVSVGSRPSGIASSVVQPIAGQLADMFGRRRMMVIGSAVGVLSLVCFVISALTRSLIPLSLAYLFLGLALLGYPATQALVAESASMDTHKVNVAFNLVFFFTALPGAIIPFAAGFLVSTFGFTILFVGGALLELSNLFLLLPRIRDIHQQAPFQEVPGRASFSLRGLFTLPPGMLRIYMPFAMDAFSYGLAGAIIYGMWTRAFGFTDQDIGLIFGTLSISIVASQYFATKLLLAIGTRKIIAFSEGLTVVIMLGWLLFPVLPVLIFLSVIFGISVATWVPATNSLVLRAAPVRERGSISGKLAAFRGLIAFPAPIIGGFLFNSFGYYLPVALGLIGEIMTVFAILLLLPRQD